MKIIKLNAIDSTNTFLKQLAADELVENFTIVVAESQTNGKGQRGSDWVVESGKNLTFSVLYRNNTNYLKSLFTLNCIVAISIVEALQSESKLIFQIKWPNDILAENKKIGGILIENSIKNQEEVQSIIGIGINVNQTQFEHLPQAASLALLENTIFDKMILLEKITNQLKFNLERLGRVGEDFYWNLYHQKLFKKDVVSTFENTMGNRFVGKIIRVSKEGKLEVLLDDDIQASFDIKEIKMLY